jgi:hypothetical protein
VGHHAAESLPPGCCAALARALAFVRIGLKAAADFGGLWFDCRKRGRRLTLSLRETLLDKGLREGLHLVTSVVCDAIQNASFPSFDYCQDGPYCSIQQSVRPHLRNALLT